MIRSNHDLVSKTEQEVEHLKNEMKRRDEREQAMMQQMTRLNKQVCDLEKNVVSKSDLTEVMLEERQATHTLIKDATSEQKANLLELRAIMAALSSKLDGMV
jgi:Mg2+ and Co2+ transporter CorA